ncbi:hypothetical protein E3U23_03105 [Erythrobacter litoralis]|uniref:hypothetical protein n=1 Tax=Erythrobacter litoralis TaxID=39960 RepID=UPI0024359514|nr:hypothetical protein [Erythrobacter litoralis]MDG6078176.1 hypothetical protein [Erythrobacter litoralis]
MIISVWALILLVPLAFSPVIPSIDLYSHIARYWVLANIDDPVLQENYRSAWAILPNLGLDLIGVILVSVVSPEITTKIIVGGVLLIQYFGALYASRLLSGKDNPNLPPLLCILAYSYILGWGFSNFLFGLGLAFWNFALWVRFRKRVFLATMICSMGAFVVFLAHGLAFALYGLIVGCYELSRWYLKRTRHLEDLASRTALLGAQALIPASLFFLSKTSDAEGQTGGIAASIDQHMAAGSLIDRLFDLFAHRSESFFRLAEGPYLALDVVTVLCLAGLLTYGLTKKALRILPVQMLAIGLFTVLLVLTPPNLFGVGYIADRIPLVLALVFSISQISQPYRANKAVRHITLGLSLLAVIRIGTVSYGYSKYSETYRDFVEITRYIPTGSIVLDTSYPSKSRKTFADRCNSFLPLVIASRKAAVPIFAYPSQQPIAVIGPLRRAVTDRKETIARTHDSQDVSTTIEALTTYDTFDFLFVCDHKRIKKPLPNGVSVVAISGQMLLLRNEGRVNRHSI